jgi:hypothetical protein
VFEYAFKLRVAYVSWKALQRAMKRKHRNNSIDTSPSTSSESSTIIVSLALVYVCLDKVSYRFYLKFFFLSVFFIYYLRLASVIVFTKEKNKLRSPYGTCRFSP